MHDEHPHPLLAQVPLTVSPFLSLPTATTLPYTYKSLPSHLPPSVVEPAGQPSNLANPSSSSPAGGVSTSSSTPNPQTTTSSSTNLPPPTGTPTTNNSTSNSTSKSAYVTSASGQTAAHPDDIIASCHALQAHLRQMEVDSRALVHTWEARIHDRELAEKRRVAPGWLDEETHLLVPERRMGDADADGDPAGMVQEGRSVATGAVGHGQGAAQRDEAGEQLDRAFGAMEIRR